jgi:hypothetical protein
MRWIGSMILGIVLWYVLTLILGFVMGLVMGLVMGFERLDHVMKYSIYYKLMLYPVGVWLAFKMTKTPFWGKRPEK